jgi:glucose-6-phosphate dehydrogenase assembly protein OpcA
LTSHESGKLSEALSHVEHELAAIWAPDEGGPPKARVCTANLVVVASGSRRAGAVALVDQLQTADVARTFLVSLDPKLPPWAMSTEVSARCQKDGEGLLCSERIDLSLGAATVPRAASVVSSLCVAEVPTVVLLLEAAPAILTAALIRDAARLVVDSDIIGLDAVTALARGTHAHIVDLAWERLLPIRNQIAACFDDERLRPAVTAIRKLTITTTTTEGGAPAPHARLLVGWMASRLGWRLVSETSAFDPLHGAIELELAWVLRGEHRPGALVSVELEALLGDASVHLAISCDPASGTLHVVRSAEGVGVETSTLTGAPQPASELVDRAVAEPLRDAATRQALFAAAGYPPGQVVVPHASASTIH